MDSITAFAVEGRKHHMTYGQYVRAVERGELIPPGQKNNAHSVLRKIRACSRCAATFELHTTPSGKLSQARLCPSCLKESQRSHGASQRKWSEYIVCKKCGTPFKRERYPNGRLTDRKYCENCRKPY